MHARTHGMPSVHEHHQLEGVHAAQRAEPIARQVQLVSDHVNATDQALSTGSNPLVERAYAASS
jgi:hypothetical protein